MLVRQGLLFGVSVVLARILSPEEFGTVALLYLFVGVASAFVDGGFSAALIRFQDATHVDESTVFWINLILALVVAASLALAAPAIADFYALPVLVPLTIAMALNVLLTAIGSIHTTLLTKKLNFRVQLRVGLIASLVSGALAIWMAIGGFGVWALAAQVVVATTVSTILLWGFSSWRPLRTISAASARRLFSFGGYMFASSLLDAIYMRFYTVLVGKLFGVRELGFYTRAEGMKQLPVGILTGILSRVAFPIFSSVAGDQQKLVSGVRLAVRSMMLINVPMMLGLAALAEPATIALLGQQWASSAPILQALCVAGIFWPLHVINLNALMAQGYSALFFRLEVIKKLTGIGLLALGAMLGVMGIAWSTAVFGLVAFVINAHYTNKFLGYGFLAQTLDFLPSLAASAFMFSVVATLSFVWSPSPLVEVLSLSVLGGLVFVCLCLLFKVSAFRDVVALRVGRGGIAE